uniref:Uncharacterized protein n=1 Tax=Anguilla anguilla TaxID=7936 RepID=A0A0E9TTP2_ANGAN
MAGFSTKSTLTELLLAQQHSYPASSVKWCQNALH